LLLNIGYLSIPAGIKKVKERYTGKYL